MTQALLCSNTAIVAQIPLRWNADAASACLSPRSQLEASSSQPVFKCPAIRSCDGLRVRKKRGFGFGVLVIPFSSLSFSFSLWPAAARGASRSVGVSEADSKAGGLCEAGGVASTMPGFSTLVVGVSLDSSCFSLGCASRSIDYVKKSLRSACVH